MRPFATPGNWGLGLGAASQTALASQSNCSSPCSLRSTKDCCSCFSCWLLALRLTSKSIGLCCCSRHNGIGSLADLLHVSQKSQFVNDLYRSIGAASTPGCWPSAYVQIMQHLVHMRRLVRAMPLGEVIHSLQRLVTFWVGHRLLACCFLLARKNPCTVLCCALL